MEYEEFASEYAAMQNFKFIDYFTMTMDHFNHNQPVYIQPNRADRRKAKKRARSHHR